MSASVSCALSDGPNPSAIGAARPTIFSPAWQLRADAGLEYTHTWSKPRFRGDRQHALGLGYLVGTDNDGTTYHHPSIRIGLKFGSGLAIDARADAIRSRVYDETSASVEVSVPLSPRRARNERRK